MVIKYILANLCNEDVFQLEIDNFSYFSVLFIGTRFGISLNEFIDAVFDYKGIYTDSMNVFFDSELDCNNFIVWLESLLIANKLST